MKNKLTEEEKSNIDFEVADILNPIINSNDKEIIKIITAFQEGIKYCKEKIVNQN